MHDKFSAVVFSRRDLLDYLDLVLPVSWCGSSRTSLASYTSYAYGAGGLFQRALQLTILMKSTFAQDDGKNETVEQTRTPSKEKGDLESVVSSEC